MKELGFHFGVEAGGPCRQAKEVDCLGSLADSLQTMRTPTREVVAEIRGALIGEGPEQIQFVKLF